MVCNALEGLQHSSGTPSTGQGSSGTVVSGSVAAASVASGGGAFTVVNAASSFAGNLPADAASREGGENSGKKEDSISGGAGERTAAAPAEGGAEGGRVFSNFRCGVLWCELW